MRSSRWSKRTSSYRDPRAVVSTTEPDRAAAPGVRPMPPELLARAAAVLRRVAPRLMGPVLRQRCRTSDLVQSALADAVASWPTFRGENESEFVGWTLR